MGEHDIAFRHLLRELPDPLLQLAFPHKRLKVLGPIDASADRPRQLTTDALIRVREGRHEAIVHVEVERGWRPELPRRIFEYSAAAHARTGSPIVSVVLLLRRGGKPPRSPAHYRVHALGHDTHVLRYHVVSLWELDAETMRKKLPPEGWAFCAAMRGANARFVRGLADELSTRKDVAPQRRDLGLGLLFVVTAAILGSATAKGIFQMDSIMQSPGVQEIMREWADKQRVDWLRTACLDLLAAKLSSAVPANLSARIDRLSDATILNKLLIELGTAADAQAAAAAVERRG